MVASGSWIPFASQTFFGLRRVQFLADGSVGWMQSSFGGIHRSTDHGRVWVAPAAVVQLLDRHNRDAASLAAELDVPHLVVPDALPGTPFKVVSVRDTRRWHEVAVWWPSERTLVVAEAVGTNPFFAGGRAAGVHLLLRLAPPRAVLGGFRPQHLLVGHGEGVHGAQATEALEDALATSRTGLARLVPRIPGFALDAVRRRR